MSITLYVNILSSEDFRGKYLACNVDIVHVRLGNLCPDLGYEVQDELNIVSFTLLSVNIPVGTNVSTPLHNISNPLSSPASLVTIRSHDDAVIS